MVLCQCDYAVLLSGNMAIKRDRRMVESSDSDDDDDDNSGDESVSGDGWTSRSGGSTGNSKTARTDVAVDYSIASSSQSNTTRSGNTPRRHTGPRKPRVHEKVRLAVFLISSVFCLGLCRILALGNLESGHFLEVKAE